MILVGAALGAVVAAQAATLTVELRERGSGAPVEEGWVEVDGQRLALDGDRLVLDLPAGPVTLRAGSPRHEEQTLTLTLPREAPLRLYLRRYSDVLEVVVEARRPSPHPSRQILDRERIEETPGAFDDPFRLVQSLPGTAITREFGAGSGDIILRGAPPAESRVYLDGVELPYLYHFDQYASVVPARQLDELAVYPSGVGPAWGDLTGGVVAAESRSPEPGLARGMVDANFIMAGGELAVPLGERATISGSGRRSYLDLATRGNDQYTAWPVFYDANLRLDLRPAPPLHLHALLLGAGDAYARYAGDTALLDPLEAESEPVFQSDRDFQALLLGADRRGPRAREMTRLGLVRDAMTADLGEAREAHRLGTISARHESLRLFGAQALAFGADGRLRLGEVESRTERAWPELQGEAPRLALGRAEELSIGQAGGGLWVEPRLRAGSVGVQPGLRVQGDSRLRAPALDPRVVAQLELGEDLRLRAGGGLYHQAPRAEEVEDPPAALAWARAVQAVVGAEGAVAGRLELSAEAWGRHRRREIEGEGARRALSGGLDLLSRYRLRERIFAAASLSLARAREEGVPMATD